MIYVVRHGETDGNNSGILRGKAFDDELNARGFEQAKQVANQLQKIDFDICYCSPLKRTKQTRDQIFNGKTIYDNRLLPREYGTFAGKVVDAMNQAEYWDRKLNLSDFDCEKILDFEKRVFAALDEIVKKHKGKNVLVVTHASVCRIVKAYTGGTPKNNNYMKDSSLTKNCEILEIPN